MSQTCHFRTRTLQQGEAYSITSSANVSKVGGTPMPNCFAVLALTTTQDLGWQRPMPLFRKPVKRRAWLSHPIGVDNTSEVSFNLLPVEG
jgi:hypothetical protein